MTRRGAAVLTPEQRTAWQAAQRLWGVELHDPELAPNAKAPSFAWFAFPPQVTFDLPEASRLGVGDFLESIFAHEIGHHALSPSTRITGLKIAHQLARALAATDAQRIPKPEDQVHQLSNLWSDLLINVRVAELQRRRDANGAQPEMVRMWQVLAWQGGSDRMWWVVLRAYEMLWTLPAGTLCPADPPAEEVDRVEAERRETARRGAARQKKLDIAAALAAGKIRLADELEQQDSLEVQIEFDALARTNPELDSGLLAETVRAFGNDPVSGALRFGMLMAPYLVRPGLPTPTTRTVGIVRAGLCAGESGATAATDGDLVAVLGDARLQEAPEHPAMVKARAFADRAHGPAAVLQAAAAAAAGAQGATGQGYGLANTLRLYHDSNANAVIAAWYQTRARSYVRPLLQRSSTAAVAGSEIPGALESWELGDDLADIDWAASMARGTTVVPGVTTRRREFLPDIPPVATVSVDLDLYIDSSGSMTSPARESPAVLAGSILILSVLRGGGRVRVTSFSAAGQVAGGARFTRDRLEALRDLTTYFGSGTVFPLDLYGARYRGATGAPATGGIEVRRHVVVLSDEGLLSMFGAGQPQFADVAGRVRRSLDSATLILQDSRRSVAEPAAAAGYDVEYIQRMTDAPAACARLAHRLATAQPVPVTGSRARTRGGFRG